ncbi:MAG: hypothetical protein AB1758_29790 [Candidatus Eremiobacterota bacterium]
MERRAGTAGLSLTETVISLVLLIAAFFIVVRLFHTGLRYLGQVERHANAVLLAERTMEDLRAWAEQGRNFDDWTPYASTAVPVTDMNGYRIQVRSSAEALASPASGFEDLQPAPDRRMLQSSCRRVEVTVLWDSDRKSLRLVSLVSEPVRGWRAVTPIEVRPSGPLPNPLARDAPVTFTAHGFDSDGREIPDLFFKWYLAPSPGNGTLTQSRDGRSATFTNVVVVPLRPPIYTGQSVVIQARALYRGQERLGSSAPVNLQP